MNRFKFWNNCIGWLSFTIAAVVYISTLEPTLSFWDCGEFIATSYKLQVCHSPGAPFYLLLTKVFSLLTSNPGQVALMVNAFSALSSAFTILFLFFTITHFTRRILTNKNSGTNADLILILGAGFIGAMAYTFSDSFWFSAVEAEVYATSSLFTAVVFWAILKWEETTDERYANRWIILIAYLMGLSIGVHLLNLLAIPAIVMVIYFKKFKATVWGFFIALFCSFVILAFFQYGIIPGIFLLASVFELYFINRLHFPFNSGIIIYFILLFLLFTGSLWLTYYKKKVVANTIILSITMLILGYSSYAMIVIRSTADTPINENRPDNVFSLLSYINREQYGDRPLFYGPYYNAPVDSSKKTSSYYAPVGNRYDSIDYKIKRYYNPRFTTVFPRMYSTNPDHIEVYKTWAAIHGKPITVKKNNEQVIEYKPSFVDNLEFFVAYQVGYMYFRYLMWNFSGKQNNIDGNGGILYGNAITGFPIIDNAIYGPQELLPTSLKNNPGHNRYFLLPFLLGIFGMIYQFRKNKSGFSIVLLLFFMTGLAIVIYLNQTPLQPRERDYSYVGSFYAFAIWIGIGAASIASFFKHRLKSNRSVYISLPVIFLAVPLWMAFENWDDHDRSGRYITHDIAYNYLNSCAPNSILITVGDNDLFPLWYLQEVEGIRRDVRVVNHGLLSFDWYIRSMQKKQYNTDPVPMSFKGNDIRTGKKDYIFFKEETQDYIDIKKAFEYVTSTDISKKRFSTLGDTLDCFNTRNFLLPVDTNAVIKGGCIKPSEISLIDPSVKIQINNQYIQKADLMLLDILAENNWKRPVYFTYTGPLRKLNMLQYLRIEGPVYRLIPIPETDSAYLETGSVESNILYKKMMEASQWKSISDPRVLKDYQCINTFVLTRYKYTFGRLINQLALEGKTDSAIQVINRYFEITPPGTIPPDRYSIKLAEACYLAGDYKRGDQLLLEYRQYCIEELNFYNSLTSRLAQVIKKEKKSTQNALFQINAILQENKRIIK